MKRMKNEACVKDDECLSFLADYASSLSGCGATCARIEKNIGRMARALGIDVSLTVMPFHVEVVSAGHAPVVRKVLGGAINFDMNARLSRLSWDMADRKCDLTQASERFARIKSLPVTNPWKVLCLSSLANAAFCRLFGGDIAAMALVFISTFVGFRLRQIMMDRCCDRRFAIFCASFFSTILASAGQVFSVGNTPGIAVCASVLYLIPGVPYINAVSDVIDCHYLCAFSRFMDAMVITVCISLGLCLGMYLMDLKWI